MVKSKFFKDNRFWVRFILTRIQILKEADHLFRLPNERITDFHLIDLNIAVKYDIMLNQIAYLKTCFDRNKTLCKSRF